MAIAPRSKRTVAAVSSYIALSFTVLAAVFVIQARDLNLRAYLLQISKSYVPSSSVDVNSTSTNASAQTILQASAISIKNVVYAKLPDEGVTRKEKQRLARLADIAKAKEKLARLSSLHTQLSQTRQISPACHPHFSVVTSNSTLGWTDRIKFKRMYFYHARKAGGTSLGNYFSKVAKHHGLQWDSAEWEEAEEPGSHELPTFYVAHLREPVDRSISHFKYQGRWECSDLSHMRRKDNTKFIPTEDNANKIETWNQTQGHVPTTCNDHFRLGECAVNCYVQWFSGLSCPQYNVTATEQYQTAKAKLLRYNFIIVLEKLKDLRYAKAIEDFFGVPGVRKQRGAYCERSSHLANRRHPLVIKNETQEKLVHLNDLDVTLYNELSGCLHGNRASTFPKLDKSRFDNVTGENYLDKEDKSADNDDKHKMNITIITPEGDDGE